MTDLSTRVGSLLFAAPVLTASGTSGHGAELSNYFDLSELGAIVVKSLRVEPWSGNPAPRVHSTGASTINSVGLQGPGIEWWLTNDLPALVDTGGASGRQHLGILGGGLPPGRRGAFRRPHPKLWQWRST